MTEAVRKPTPRPSFIEPTVIASGKAVKHTWGDGPSGHVYDDVVVSSRELHVLEFTLSPGTQFVQSEANPTIFDADVVYVVLQGSLWVRDAESGQTIHLQQGEAAWIRPRTWHQGFNPSAGAVRTLELFAAPPSRGTASQFALQQPFLSSTQTVLQPDQDWPSTGLGKTESLVRLSPAGWRWSFAPDTAAVRWADLMATRDLIVRQVHCEPGASAVIADLRADALVRAIDPLVVTVTGALGERTIELSEGDALFIPRCWGEPSLVASGMSDIGLSRSWFVVGSPDPELH